MVGGRADLVFQRPELFSKRSMKFYRGSLNPVKYVWGTHLGRVVTVTDIETVVQQHWQNILQHSIDHVLVVCRIIRRVGEVMNSRGGPNLLIIQVISQICFVQYCV